MGNSVVHLSHSANIFAFRLFCRWMLWLLMIDAKKALQLTESACDINAVEEGIPLVTFPLPPQRQNGTVYRENLWFSTKKTRALAIFWCFFCQRPSNSGETNKDITYHHQGFAKYFLVVIQLNNRLTRTKISCTTIWKLPNLRIWLNPAYHASYIMMFPPPSPPRACRD